MEYLGLNEKIRAMANRIGVKEAIIPENSDS